MNTKTAKLIRRKTKHHPSNQTLYVAKESVRGGSGQIMLDKKCSRYNYQLIKRIFKATGVL